MYNVHCHSIEGQMIEKNDQNTKKFKGTNCKILILKDSEVEL